MSISSEDRVANRDRHPFRRGKDVGRNRLRAGAHIDPCNRIAGSYRGSSRARDALVAHGLHRDDGSTDSIASGCRLLSAFDAPLFAARAGRAYAP